MRINYAKIIGHHTVQVIECTSGLKSALVDVTRMEGDSQPPVCELAVSINFKGHLNNGDKVQGCVSCGFLRAADSLSLMKALARHYGLDDNIVSTLNGLTDLLGELLNVIVGLAGADWSGYGFDIDFTPPEVFNGRQLLLSHGSDSYHITASIDKKQIFNLVISFDNL